MIGTGIIVFVVGLILAFGSGATNVLLSIANVDTATNTVVIVTVVLGALAVLTAQLSTKRASLKPVGVILAVLFFCWAVVLALENLLLTDFSGFTWSANNSTISKIGLVLIGLGAGMLIGSFRSHSREPQRRKRERESE